MYYANTNISETILNQVKTKDFVSEKGFYADTEKTFHTSYTYQANQRNQVFNFYKVLKNDESRRFEILGDEIRMSNNSRKELFDLSN